MESEKPLNRLRLWRSTDAGRIPVDIFVTEDLVIDRIEVAEKSATLENMMTSAGAYAVNADDPDLGGRTPLFVEEIPCWFDGCEKLRRDYNEEAARLALRIEESEGRKCRGCDFGDLRRKYIWKMRQLGAPLHPASARNQQIPRSGPSA